MVVKRKSPLSKRYIRDLKNDFGKYAVIFLLLTLTVGFSSGYIIAGDSMIKTYNDSFAEYNIEHGHFVTQAPLNHSKQRAISELGVNTYELFYNDVETEAYGTLRLFKDRDEINKVCLMDGELPKSDDEIAVDRMYADNNKLSIGDVIKANDREYKISATVALSDYSAMFSDNDDMMFDAKLFGVAVVTDAAFDSYMNPKYCYAWKYQNFDATSSEKDMADDFMKGLNKLVKIEEFVPRYQNHAINFTGDDLGGDRVMMEVLLYIITVIVAFVFAITTKDTIEKESAVIGTLRATGYTKNELIRHYMVMPILVTLASAFIGNILGYTFFKDICVDLYYNSYSLTKYQTVWSAEAFVRTTLIPLVLMGVVSWFVLRSKFSRTPLEFMRRNLGSKRKKNALPLNPAIPFTDRFRMRIVLQNIPNYLTLFIGILFASILLLFGLMLPSIMEHQTETITGSIIADYQYMLSVPSEALDEDNMTTSMMELMNYSRAVETKTPGAEKFSAYSLKTIPEGNKISDEISLYGIKQGSEYIKQEMSGDDVYVSSLYQDKYETEIGDVITLKEPYDDDTYSFIVTGVYEYDGSLCLFMNDKYLNKLLDLPENYFSGYFSNEEIKDIDEKYIGTVIDFESLTKVSRQLMISFGSFMKMLNVFAVTLAIILIYLLSKIIIEKNANSISMIKILGYKDSEVSKLYIMSTTIIVVISTLISLYLSYEIIIFLWKAIIASRMSGWIPLVFDKMIFAQMTAMIFGAFAIVAVLEMRKIKKIPMTDALKNVE